MICSFQIFVSENMSNLSIQYLAEGNLNFLPAILTICREVNKRHKLCILLSFIIQFFTQTNLTFQLRNIFKYGFTRFVIVLQVSYSVKFNKNWLRASRVLKEFNN